MVEKTSKVEKNRGNIFEKGKPKTGGRKKGTPNKKTKLFLDELGNFSTVKEMIKLFKNTKDDNIKLTILKEFLKYEYPQRKAVEMTAEVGATETTQEAFLKHLKDMGEKKNDRNNTENKG